MKLKLKDGSTYNETETLMRKAIKMRQKEVPDFLPKMVETIDKYWQMKKIPTKFGWDIDWEKKYKNQAALAPVVVYQFVRPIMMGLMFEKLTKGDKSRKPGKVIAVDPKGNMTEYPSGKKVKKL